MLRTRDSSRIYLPLAVMVALNAALWLAFGFAIGDYFIWCAPFPASLAVLPAFYMAIGGKRLKAFCCCKAGWLWH